MPQSLQPENLPTISGILPASLTRVKVSARLNPFEPDVATFLASSESTLSHLVNVAYLETSHLFFEHGAIEINGVPIPKHLWSRVRPRAGTIVTMYLVPGKSSTVLLTLAAVALTVATAGIAAGGIATVFGLGAASTFAAGGLGATLAAAGVGVVGSLALTALTPPPSAINDLGGAQQQNTAGISQNQLTPFQYLPAVLGTMRVSPPLLSPAWTELEEGEVFINGTVGLYGQYDISSIELNGVDITLFGDVTYETRQGLASDSAPTQNYTVSVAEQRPNLKLSYYQSEPKSVLLLDSGTPANSYPDWHLFRVPAPGDDGKVVLRFFWPTGLNQIGDTGGINRGSVGIRLEIKEVGTGTWYKLPDLWFQGLDVDSGEIRQHVILQWMAAGSVGSSTLAESTSRYSWVAISNHAPGSAWERNAETIYDGTANRAKGVSRDNRDGYQIDISNSALDGDVEYEIRVRLGQTLNVSNMDWAAFTYSGDASQGESVFDYDLGTANPEMVGRGGSPGSICYVESVASHKTANAFDYRGIASIAFRAKGLDIQSLSAIFSSIIPIYSASEPWNTTAASNNPGALYRHVLTNTQGNSATPPGEILDEDNLADFYDHCVTMGYTCNAVVSGLSVPQVLQMIASTGWAVPRYGDLWGVIMEKDRSAESIVQLFTPLNSKDKGTFKALSNLPHAIRGQANDEDSDYEISDEVVVYAPGYNASTAQKIETIIYQGITDLVQLDDRVNLDMDQLYLRQNRYVREVFYEGLVSSRGDLVGLTDEVLEQTHAYGLIKQVLTSGGNITGLVLENIVDFSQPVDPFDVTDTLAVSVRKADGTVDTRTITTSTVTDTITYTTPFADTGVILAGQIVGIGISGTTYKRCIIFSIERNDDDTALLTLIDEAPEIHT